MNCDQTPHCDDCYVSTDPARIDFGWLTQNLLTQSWANCWRPERLRVAIAHSLCFGLYQHTAAGTPDQMIGFARVITDGATYSLLVDVVIEPAARGRGLGKFLLQTIMEHPNVRPTVSLLRTNTAGGLYEKFGYQPVSAMRRLPVAP